MNSALAQLLGPLPEPAAGSAQDVMAEMRFQVAQLGDIARTYRHTNHESKRRRLTAMHKRLRELLAALDERLPPGGVR